MTPSRSAWPPWTAQCHRGGQVIAVASDGARSARGCRGAGFAVGALVAGMAADLPGLAAATWLVAGLTGTPGLILAARRHETQRRGRTGRRCQATPRP